MEALRIEILNPKALQLLKGMQELNLIKVSDSASELKKYLRKMRRHTRTSPPIEEITTIVEQVRKKRYAKKKKG
jgi:hypothetical protein